MADQGSRLAGDDSPSYSQGCGHRTIQVPVQGEIKGEGVWREEEGGGRGRWEGRKREEGGKRRW